MFLLLQAEDTVVLEPHELDSVHGSVEMRLQIRYKNKIIQGEGPCLVIKNVQVIDKVVI